MLRVGVSKGVGVKNDFDSYEFTKKSLQQTSCAWRRDWHCKQRLFLGKVTSMVAAVFVFVAFVASCGGCNSRRADAC